MTEEKTSAKEEEKAGSSEPKLDELKPDFTDYIALTIAMLQTTLLPFLLILASIFLLYISVEVAVNYGLIWLLAVWLPFGSGVVLARRFLRWRRMEKVKAALR